METKRGLVADDQLSVFRGIKRILAWRLPQYAVDVATTPEQAMSKVDASLSWITLDLCFGPHFTGLDRDLRGLNVALALRLRGLRVPIVFITGLGPDDIGDALDVQALGARTILYKPISPDILVDTLTSVADAKEGMPSAPAIPEPPRTLPDLRKTKEGQTLDLVEDALSRFGSKRGAARHLGVDRRTILRYSKQLEEMGRLPPARPPARPQEVSQ